MQSLDELKTRLLTQIEESDSSQALEEIRVDALGKKGVLSAQLKALGSMPAEERKSFGQLVNQVKQDVTDALSAKAALLAEAAMQEKLAREAVDVTLPVPSQSNGRMHPHLPP